MRLYDNMIMRECLISTKMEQLEYLSYASEAP